MTSRASGDAKNIKPRGLQCMVSLFFRIQIGSLKTFSTNIYLSIHSKQGGSFRQSHVEILICSLLLNQSCFNKRQFYFQNKRFATLTGSPQWHICSALFLTPHNNSLTFIGFSLKAFLWYQFNFNVPQQLVGIYIGSFLALLLNKHYFSLYFWRIPFFFE